MSTDADGRSKPADDSSKLTEDGPVAIRIDAEGDPSTRAESAGDARSRRE
jgi:hypothetical protein